MQRKTCFSIILVAMSLLFMPDLFSQPKSEVVWKEINGVSMPIPPKVHPRLYLRAENIPDLSNRVNDPALKKVWGELIKLQVDKTPTEIPENKDWRFYFDTKGLLTRVELKALSHLMTGNAQDGRDAIEMIVDTLETAIYPNISDISRAIGRLMVSGAIVYDWCYGQLKPAEKTRFVNAFVRLAKMLECGYPPVKDNSIVGHASEWMIMRDLISTGIAIYDEFPEMYHLSAGRFFREHLPVRNWFYPSEAYHQGMSYLNVRFSNDLYALWIFDRMGAGNVYNPSQQYILYDMIYKRRPDGQVMPGGDVNYTRKRQVTYSLPSFLAGSYYKDEYVNYEFMRDPRVDNQNKIFEFLWRDTKVGSRNSDDLPLTRYSGSPYGWMVARTGWGAESVIAEMKINEYNFLNHQHHDAGAFQIYYKGPLAIDAGTYQGASGGYNSPHNKNFFKRTIAHNSLLVYDPNELFPASGYGGADKSDFVTNDGGQRLPNNWTPAAKLEQLLSGGYKTGTILAKSVGVDKKVPEYSYLKGDITPAYSAKVKEMKRSFVFLNLKNTEVPAALIVFDKVLSANPAFKKFWLLHSIEQPEISANKIIIKRTKNGDTGMLTNTVLLPDLANADIVPVGGEGKEFWVFGTNYPNEPRPGEDEANERGAWRVEVSPKRVAAEDYYLNVLQVTDATKSTTLDVKRIDNEKIVGVQIADRITTFSKNSLPLEQSFNLSASGSGMLKFLITDLLPGKWQVLKDGKSYLENVNVLNEEGIISFEGTAGEYRFVNYASSINEVSLKGHSSNLILYPNPANNELNILFTNTAQQKIALSVFAASGRKMFEETIQTDALEYTHKIDICNYPKGTYLVEFRTKELANIGKFIKI